MEHLFSDAIIQEMMPHWLAWKRPFSILAGMILLGGGLSILLGFKMTWGGLMLSVFLLTVTLAVHLPAVFNKPGDLPVSWHWLWDVYQRSNLVKNLCLLGVCFHLINHEPGRFSLDGRAARKDSI